MDKQKLTLTQNLVLYGSGLVTLVLLLIIQFRPGGHAGHVHGEASGPVVLAPTHDCSKVQSPKTITVTITDTAFEPKVVTANLCDKLHFVNAGKEEHKPDAGPHPSDDSYPEMNAPAPLKPGQSFDTQLNRLGDYSFHDHLHEEIIGALLVN